MAIRLALAGLALAVAVLGPLAAQAVTVTWAVDAKWSGGGPADAALGAPDARFGRSGSLALGRGGAAFFDFGAPSPARPTSSRPAGLAAAGPEGSIGPQPASI